MLRSCCRGSELLSLWHTRRCIGKIKKSIRRTEQVPVLHYNRERNNVCFLGRTRMQPGDFLVVNVGVGGKSTSGVGRLIA